MTVRRLIGGLAVLSVVMIVPAGAAERPDDHAGPIGVGGVTEAGTVQFRAYGTADTIAARIDAGLDAYGNEIAAARPDDRAARFTPATGEPTVILPDDRAERFTPGSVTQPVIATPTTDTGIDWSDPLIVGAATVLVAGLATLAAFAVVHRRGGGPGMRGTPGTPTPIH